MKRRIIFLPLLLFACSGAMAQQDCSSLYWVVESTLQRPSLAVIRIYNEEDALVFETTMTDRRIDITRRKSRRKLNRIVKAFEKRTLDPSTAVKPKKAVIEQVTPSARL